MPVTKLLTISDSMKDDIDSLRIKMQKAYLRPVTQTEVMQEALKLGIENMLRGKFS